jgi:hypothetical protein
MAQSAATQVMIVKADIDGDMRRISITVPEDAASPQMLQAIRESVAQAFNIDGAKLPALKYKDDDGDLCTLVEASVIDMLELNNAGTLRLFATTEAPRAPPVFVGETSTSEETPAVADAEKQLKVPGLPELPQVSEVPQLPEFPQVPELPHVAEVKSAQQKEEAGHDHEDDADQEAGAGQDAEAEALQQEDDADQQAEAEAVQQEDETKIHEADEDEEETEQEQPNKISLLVAMGFDSWDATQALEDACGNIERAVELLSDGRPTQRSPFEKLESSMRDLVGEVVGELREMVANLKQQQRNMQERYSNGKLAPPQSMQAALEEVMARLRECSHLAQGAVKKARGAVPAEHEEEQLRRVQDQIADAQQFLTEAIAAYRDAASEILHRKRTSTPAESSESDSVPAKADDSSTATMETINAAVLAAVDAAQEAMTTVEKLLINETGSIAEEEAELEDDSEFQQASLHNATVLDHAQVFLSQSMSAVRSRTSELFRARRPCR